MWISKHFTATWDLSSPVPGFALLASQPGVEVGESQKIDVYWGALVDYWLGERLLTITQGDVKYPPIYLEGPLSKIT